ncbi:hypothetical protein MNBD_ALPHA09-382 [hydrothermal vent metagenome]|uniref:Uncharacterized protein n=1 Tax=hydrothermal vent metagenome TaxID=652676 RepID=A0A3B0UAX7_9ZZZZ
MTNSSADRSMKNAIVRAAILEAPAVVLLAIVLAYLFVFENNLSGDDILMWLIVAVGVFLLYVSFLFVTILVPAMGGGRDAR